MIGGPDWSNEWYHCVARPQNRGARAKKYHDWADSRMLGSLARGESGRMRQGVNAARVRYAQLFPARQCKPPVLPAAAGPG